MYMQVVKLEEAGYHAAMTGLALSYKTSKENAEVVARKLASKDGGHNKFLESIYVWLSVRAPRYWWQEADTFRLSTKQSESTMHTLVKELQQIPCPCTLSEATNKLTAWVHANFEEPSVVHPDQSWLLYRMAHDGAPLWELKSAVPEGFLQERVWCLSYKTLRNIILQRRTHRLPHWQSFIKQVLEQASRPTLLPTLEVEADA